MGSNIGTPFSLVYDKFTDITTDDLYLELTELDTYRLLEKLLLNAIVQFEFPRQSLDYELMDIEDIGTYKGVDSDNKEVPLIYYTVGYFKNVLTDEEIIILAYYMAVEWVGQQLLTVDNTRMKYSSDDFKMTSQANHMSKLLTVKEHYKTSAFHLQRLYKRRKKNSKGVYVSTMSEIMFNNKGGYTP